MVLLHDLGQSLAHLLVDAIFSTKDRRPSRHRKISYLEEIREIFKRHRGHLRRTLCLGLKLPRVGRPFRAGRFISLHPGLKRPTSQSLRRGWLFGVTYHNTRGAIASATAAWAILLDRSAVARKRPNSRPRA